MNAQREQKKTLSAFLLDWEVSENYQQAFPFYTDAPTPEVPTPEPGADYTEDEIVTLSVAFAECEYKASGDKDASAESRRDKQRFLAKLFAVVLEGVMEHIKTGEFWSSTFRQPIIHQLAAEFYESDEWVQDLIYRHKRFGHKNPSIEKMIHYIYNPIEQGSRFTRMSNVIFSALVLRRDAVFRNNLKVGAGNYHIHACYDLPQNVPFVIPNTIN